MIDKVRVYFMGAGEVAVPILLRLANSDIIELCGIATQIDKEAGRKKVLTATPVAKIADLMGLQVEKVPSVNEAGFIERLKQMDLDFIVVVSFGQFLKKEILELPRYRCINIHTSILPKYRGASPIISTLLNRDKYAGVSFMEMDLTMDTGAVYQCIEIPVEPDDTAMSLENRLGQMAANHVDRVLLDIKIGHLNPTLQDNTQATYCSKIKKQMGLVDWAKHDSLTIEAMVRAFTPWPNASMILPLKNGSKLQITVNKCRIDREKIGKVGCPRVLSADKNGIFISCLDGGVIEILELTIPGKKMMRAVEFVNGYHLEIEKDLIDNE